MVEIDLSAWSITGEEQGGRDPDKVWVARHPADAREQHWLWKPRRYTLGAGGEPEEQINDTVEVIASRLGMLLGVPVADCRYGTRGDQHLGGLACGSLARNVAAPDHELHPASVILQEVAPAYQPQRTAVSSDGTPRTIRDVGYTLDAVEQVLKDLRPTPGTVDFAPEVMFAGFLVLDCLISNTDRHPQNWAVQVSPDGGRSLAPSFDHGGGLGAGMTEARRKATDVARWCGRGRARTFEDKPALLDLARAAVRRWGAEIWWQSLEAIDLENTFASWVDVRARVSAVNGTFLLNVLEQNRRRLLNED